MNILTIPGAIALRLYVESRSFGTVALHRLREDERGEGVISAAIAVLVMAFLGALMFAAFKGILGKATDNTGTQVDKIGSGG